MMPLMTWQAQSISPYSEVAAAAAASMTRMLLWMLSIWMPLMGPLARRLLRLRREVMCDES